MKVLIVFSSKDIGGAEKSITIMSHFIKKNISDEFFLSSIGGEGEWSKWARSIKLNPILSNPGKGNIKDMFSMWKIIKTLEPDLVYVMGLRLSLFFRILKFFYKEKFSLIHGIRWVPESNNKLDIFTRVIEKFLSSLIDGYITNSNAAKKVLIQNCNIDKSKVYSIYNGIATEQLRPPKKTNKRIITIANLSPRKGYIEYLKVIKKVLKRHPDAKFVFAGLDNMNGEVSKAIEINNLTKNIEYLGFLSDVKKELLASNLFVLPSLYSEGCPTSIMEAMQCGLPCIAYDICGNNELIVEGVTGLLAKKNDFEMLSEKICYLLEDKLKHNQMSRAASLRIKENFSIKKCAESHIKILSSFAKLKN